MMYTCHLLPVAYVSIACRFTVVSDGTTLTRLARDSRPPCERQHPTQFHQHPLREGCGAGSLSTAPVIASSDLYLLRNQGRPSHLHEQRQRFPNTMHFCLEACSRKVSGMLRLHECWFVQNHFWGCIKPCNLRNTWISKKTHHRLASQIVCQD